MTKLNLLKAISKVHAAKCDALSDFTKAIESFDTLNNLKGHVHDANDDQIPTIISAVKEWASKYPAVNVSV